MVYDLSNGTSTPYGIFNAETWFTSRSFQIFQTIVTLFNINHLFAQLKSLKYSDLTLIILSPKYSHLIQIIFTLLYGFKYSYQIQIICTQLYGFKYSYLIQINNLHTTTWFQISNINPL